MGLIKASLKNPFMVLAIVFMIAVLGSISAARIPVDILPVFKAPAVQVLTYYQGMPPNSVEKIISNRIERWVNQATGCSRVESKSTVGVSTIKCYFRDDIDPNGALTQVNSLALGTLAYLPPNTLPPVVLPFDPTGTMPLGIVTISNPQLNEARIKDLGRINVRMMLMGLRGVVAPAVIGGKDRTVLVYIDPAKLEARQMSLLEVVEALHKGNLMATPGVAYIGRSQFLLDSNAMVNRVDELNAFPIRLGGEDQVFLSDIGHAEDAYSIQTSRVRINGNQQVFVPVYRQGGASSLDVSNSVHQELATMEAKLPEGTTLQFIMDQSVYVREAITGLIHEGIIGAALVSLMILIFLGNPRMTLIASLSIPLAILGAVAMLHATSNTINVMTLSGLALAIGPLVDDAIVELENHHRHYSMGKSRMRASFDGPCEVILPVLVATCTTVIVLAPIALMPGMGGFLFKPLALAVAFAMLTSFILSRTFVPMMCSRILPDDHGMPARKTWFTHFHHGFESGLNRVSRVYGRLLARCLHHRGKVLFVVLALFVGSLLMLRGIGQEFFPQVDAGQITLYVRAPSNSRLDETELRIIEVEHFIERAIPAKERTTIVSELGLDPDWSAAYSPNSGQQDTVIRIQLNDERTHSAQEYASLLRHGFANHRRFDDLHFAFDTGGMLSTALNYGISSPIDVQITGGKADEATAFARKCVEEIQQVRGAADVRIQQRLDAPYRVIEIDRQKAAEVGLSASDVILQVTAALNSSVSIDRNYWIDVQTGNQYFVAVQYPENTEKSLPQILDVVATGTRQNIPVKLSSLVTLTPSNSAVEINHVDLARTYDVLVNVEGRDLGSVAKAIRKRLIELQVPKGMQWVMKGEYARMTEAFGNLAIGLVLAAMLVYLLLMGLFRSLVGPFIIMFTVPLGLIGVLTMLFLTRTTLNVQSAMGVIFLVGIAVNNGVLLIDFANHQCRAGKSVRVAVTTAATIRLRPILMTFLATTLDLIPMAIGFGRGSEATIPLARAVVGGLLTSTLLTLFVLPILYTLLVRDTSAGDTDAKIEHELTRPLPHPPTDGHAIEAIHS
jgi:CzcA family heavy metal efflux pump